MRMIQIQPFVSLLNGKPITTPKSLTIDSYGWGAFRPGECYDMKVGPVVIPHLRVKAPDGTVKEYDGVTHEMFKEFLTLDDRDQAPNSKAAFIADHVAKGNKVTQVK